MKLPKTALSILASFGIATSQNIGHIQADLYSDVSNSIREIKQQELSNATVADLFHSVKKLSESVTVLNVQVKQVIQTLNTNDLTQLTMLGQLLDFGIELVKSRYEEEIFTTFNTEFRALSNARFIFEHNIRAIKERLHGVKIVKAPNLSLSQAELNELNEALKRRENI